jgi:transposase InsO family protein
VLTDTPGKAFDKISMDIMRQLPRTHKGNKYILTIQDLLTKYSLGIPIEGITAVAEAFVKQFICLFGLPRAILTVQGTNFTSALMKKVAKRFRIKQYITTEYYPQSNEFIERSHHLLMKYLKLYIDIGTYHASLYEHLYLPRNKLLKIHSIFGLLIQRDTY